MNLPYTGPTVLYEIFPGTQVWVGQEAPANTEEHDTWITLNDQGHPYALKVWFPTLNRWSDLTSAYLNTKVAA